MELSVVLLITLLITSIIALLRQPTIIGYILGGIIAGPFVLDIISSTDTFTALAQKGVALLLFLVGLNMNPRIIREVGKISFITGIGQVAFTTTIGFIIAKLIGFSTIVSLYIAVALAFSSTIIIMKLLSDKKDLESLYAKISVGFLIVQDLIIIIILLVISSLGKETNFTAIALETLLAGLGSIAILFLFTKYALPKLTKAIAKSQEFLFLFSLTWCFAIATLFHKFNFSIEAGALLAGMALSLSPYHLEISSKMKPLRDFFLILFFIMLGSQMVFDDLLSNLVPIFLFSFFVLIGNPVIVMSLMGIFGYTKRISFHAGLTVAQISEFSLVLVTLGMTLGHITSEVLSLVTTIALITFAGSTYMIKYSESLYTVLSPYLSVFERKKATSDHRKKAATHDIILLGYDRIGYDVLESLKKIKGKFLIVDHDPETITKLSNQGFDCRFGDASNAELLDGLNFSKAKMVISTISDLQTNQLIVEKVKEANTKAIIAVVSHQIESALQLYNEGATYVIMPHLLGARHFSSMIGKHKMEADKFLEEKIEHIEHIKKRKKSGHRSL